MSKIDREQVGVGVEDEPALPSSQGLRELTDLNTLAEALPVARAAAVFRKSASFQVNTHYKELQYTEYISIQRIQLSISMLIFTKP